MWRVLKVRGVIFILLKIHEYLHCFTTYPSLETFLDLVFLFTQTSANARSFIQRMWLIPKSLSHFYVFGYCSKILCHFWFQNSTFYYLGSKSTEGLIWVPEVREFLFGFQKSGSSNLGSKSPGVLIWVPKFWESGSFNAGSRKSGSFIAGSKNLGFLLLISRI